MNKTEDFDMRVSTEQVNRQLGLGGTGRRFIEKLEEDGDKISVTMEWMWMKERGM